MVVKLHENETVLKAGDSNYFDAREKVSGKLILTNQRIYFKTLKEESKNLDFKVLFNQIKEVMFFNTWKVIPNGLSVITKEGQELKFLVKNRDQWCSMINKMY
jgi:hypothetical protein